MYNFSQVGGFDISEMNNIILRFPRQEKGERVVEVVKEILTRIKFEIKNKKGLTQKKVAKKLHISTSEFSKILAGDRPFKVKQLIKIAEILEMEIEDFFMGPERIDIKKMSMLDMIRLIVKQEIEGYLKERKSK